MKASVPKPLTLEDSNFTTRMNSYKIDAAVKLGKNLLEDPYKDQRLKQLECKLCYYRESIVMQAFTEYTCALCSSTGMHCNSGVPLLCDPCAKTSKLCCGCGASLNEKEKVSL
jgi:hypothetical protein